MTAIRGIEAMTPEQLGAEVARGGRFVVYQYCISLLIITLRQSSDIYYIPPGESASSKALPFTLLSLFLGWWGIPWGPIYTIQTLSKNGKGGTDVTPAILAQLNPPMPGYTPTAPGYDPYPPPYPSPYSPQYPQSPQYPPQYPPQPPQYPQYPPRQ